MLKITLLGLLALAAATTSTTLAYADSPLDQWRSGVPLSGIQCSEGRILMETASGKPACVSQGTSERMLERGWSVVDMAPGQGDGTMEAAAGTEPGPSGADILDPKGTPESHPDATENDATGAAIAEEPRRINPGPFGSYFRGEHITIPGTIINGVYIPDYRPNEEFLKPTREVSMDNLTATNIDLDHGVKLYESGYNSWPRYTMTFPATAQVGVPFEVTYDYAYAIPDDEGGWDDPDEQCPEEECAGDRFLISLPSYVDLLNEEAVPQGSGSGIWHVVDSDTGERSEVTLSGHSYTMDVPFDNTQQMQAIFRLVVNEPNIEYTIGDIYITITQYGDDDHSFYVDDDGTVYFENTDLSHGSKGITGESRLANTPIAEKIQAEMDSLKEIPRPLQIVHPTDEPKNGVPREFYPFIEKWLLEEHPGENYEELFRADNIKESWIQDFFTMMPHLRYDPDLDAQAVGANNAPPPQVTGAGATSNIFGMLRNVDPDGKVVPVNGATICAHDREGLEDAHGNPLSQNPDFVPVILNGVNVCGETGSGGQFLLRVPTRDYNGQGTVDLQLTAESRGRSFVIYTDNDREFVKIDNGRVYPNIGSSMLDVGFFHLAPSDDGVKHQYFWLLDRLTYIYDWYRDMDLARPHTAHVIYDEEQCANPHLELGIPTFNSINHVIHLSHTTMVRNQETILCPNNIHSPILHNDTLAHEYAHFVLYNIYDSNGSHYPPYDITDGASNHSPVSQNTDAGAWVEGWAYAMALAYSGNETYQPSNTRGQWNFEDRTHNIAQYAGMAFVEGNGGEGNVAAALYDTFDSENEGRDNLAVPLRELFRTIDRELQPGENILVSNAIRFGEDWGDSIRRPSLESVYTQNTLVYDRPPIGGDFFLDDMERGLSRWVLVNNGDHTDLWETEMPERLPQGSPPANMAAGISTDCEDGCTMTLRDPLDLSDLPDAQLRLDWWVDNALDEDQTPPEGLTVHVSHDGGKTWLLAYHRADDRHHLDRWFLGDDEPNVYDIATILRTDDFLIRITGVSDRSNELIYVDNVRITTSALPNLSGSVVFSEPFRSLGAWTERGEQDWRAGVPNEGVQPPGHGVRNTVAEADACATECILELTNGIDLAPYESATMYMYRHVDEALDSGEYLRVDVSGDGGAAWSTAFDWQGERDDDGEWNGAKLDLARYVDSDDFKVRAVALASGTDEEVGLDSVWIEGSDTARLRSMGYDFDRGLDSWSLSGDWRWMDLVPGTQPPNELSNNKVLSSNDCDDTCRATLGAVIDTSYPVMISFDRYVSRTVDRGEGLFVEYFVPGSGEWLELAKYTQDNRRDTGRWESESLTLSIPHDLAHLRFVAKSTTPSELVQIDNLRIATQVPRDTTDPVISVPPDVTIEATGARTQLTDALVGTATATDNSRTPPTITHDRQASYTLGTHPITYTARDGAGNTATGIQRVTIQDTTDPVFASTPADVTADSTDGSAVRVTFTVPSATDTVDPSVSVTSSHRPGSLFQVGTTTVTFTAEDDSGNTATHTITVTVTHDTSDRTDPVISVPRDVTIEATGPRTQLTDALVGTATATDDSGVPPTISHNRQSSYLLGTHPITYTARDGAGNTATGIQRVTIQDTTAPVFTGTPADIAATSTDGSAVMVNFEVPAATDTVDTSVDVVPSHTPGSMFEVGTTTVTFTATDDSNNSATLTLSVIVTHVPGPETIPVVIFSEDFESDAGPKVSIVNAVWTTAAPHRPSTDPDLGSKVFSAKGCSGHCMAIFDLDVSSGPITVNFDRFVSRNAQNFHGLYVLYSQPGAGFDYVVNYLAIDGKDTGTWESETLVFDTRGGQTALQFYALSERTNAIEIDNISIVQDAPLPVIIAPPDVTIEATGQMTALSDALVGTATAFFEGGAGHTITHDRQDSYPLGTHAVTYTATSGSESLAATQQVTIRDTTGPEFVAAPSDIAASSADGLPVRVHFDIPEATDTVDSQVDVVSSHAPGSLFKVGTTPVTFTATDDSGNMATHAIQVVVGLDGFDVLFVENAESGFGSWNVLRQPAHDRTWRIEEPHVAQAGIAGMVMDSRDCDPTCTAVINEPVPSTSPLQILFELFIDERVDSGEGLYLEYSADAGSTWTVFAQYEGANEGQTDRDTDRWEPEYVVLDVPEETVWLRIVAKSSWHDERIQIDDLTIFGLDPARSPPLITAPPDVTIEATGPLTELTDALLGTATATDNSGIPPAITHDRQASYPLGTHPITYTAMDGDGNTATATQRVTIQDTTDPAFTGTPADVAAESPDGSAVVVNFAIPAATDTVDTSVDVTSSHAPGSEFQLGTTQVTFTAMDDSGNDTTISMTVTVTLARDTTDPVVTAPPDVTIEATGPLTELTDAQVGAATATDDRDPSPTITHDRQASYAVGTHPITYTARDGAGNTATAVQRVTIQDTTDPVFASTLDVTANSADGFAVMVDFEVPAATDTVDTSVDVTSSHAPGSPFQVGTTTVTFTAMDDSGNSATHSILVTVTQSPAVLFSEDFESGTIPGQQPAGEDWSITGPHLSVNGQPAPDDSVLNAVQCFGHCILILEPIFDSTEPMVITFDRFVDASATGILGLAVSYAHPNSPDWVDIGVYRGNTGGNTDRWESESILLDAPIDSLRLRFTGTSVFPDNVIQVDDIVVSRLS